MNSVYLPVGGPDLASRAQAAKLRASIENLLSLGATICLNFAEVESISDSYADELFGILALSVGVDGIIERIKFEGASDDVFITIAENITNRVDSCQAA